MYLKTWKKRFFVWFALLPTAILLSGCKNTGSADTEAAVKAFGVDYMQELTVENAEQIVCTQTDTWILTTAKNDFIYRIDHTAETAKTEKIEWQQQEGESLLNLTERNGTIYISVRLADEDTIEIRRRYTGGSFQTIMQTEATDTGWYVVGSGLYVDGDGHIYLAGRTNITRFTKEGTPDCEYKIGAGSGFFTEGAKNTEPAAAEYVAAGADGITLYELNGEKAEKKWTLNTTATQIYGIRSSGSDTLRISTKDRLLYIDRESGSLLAQSELVMMGMLSVRAGFYDAEEETLRLCGESSKSTGSLSLGDFSKRDESAEKRTELIFGTAGSSNNDAPDRIKKAIMEFNRTNKDYYITIKVYGGDYCDERLQADMAAGSAPDIIEITNTSTTWSHYESYVRNGYLENLSPYLEQSEYKDDML